MVVGILATAATSRVRPSAVLYWMWWPFWSCALSWGALVLAFLLGEYVWYELFQPYTLITRLQAYGMVDPARTPGDRLLLLPEPGLPLRRVEQSAGAGRPALGGRDEPAVLQARCGRLGRDLWQETEAPALLRVGAEPSAEGLRDVGQRHDLRRRPLPRGHAMPLSPRDGAEHRVRHSLQVRHRRAHRDVHAAPGDGPLEDGEGTGGRTAAAGRHVRHRHGVTCRGATDSAPWP